MPRILFIDKGLDIAQLITNRLYFLPRHVLPQLLYFIPQVIKFGLVQILHLVDPFYALFVYLRLSLPFMQVSPLGLLLVLQLAD